MKLNIYYSIAITALLLVFCACSSNDEEDKKGNISNSIVGTWAVKNMSCFDTEELGADIITFTANKRVEAKHYEDNTGYGIFKYDDTYKGSWSIDGNKIWMTMPSLWIGPNNLVVENIQENKISFSPWGNEGAYVTMEKYTEHENSIYGYWELSMKVFSLFHKSATKDSANPPLTNVLTDSISQIVSACPGEIGVAVIVNNRDTVKVNNKSVYPMMSVFKVHQALALCNDFDNKGISLDTLVNINRDKLDPKTWSPMLKDYSGPVISLTVRDLLRYTLTQSDNNASNLMFKDMVNVAQTDSFIATLIPRSSFQIAYTEEEMSADHNKAYSNYTSPLGAAMLMNRLFTEGLIDDEKQSFIKNTLKECKTGVDRIAAPLLDKEGVVIAHKTGSGYVNENGVLAAHNDVAYICLPNNISYTLAVFVKDFKGNESQASQYVAHISAVVYSLLMQTSVKS